jgi:hypothetical protein
MALISNATTIFDNGAMASGFGGSMTFIKKLTASSSATLSFVDGTDGVVLDDTYKEYVFTFNNMHPASNSVNFSFQVNAVGASGYNETITSTAFDAFQNEDDSGAGLEYSAGRDQAQGTAFQEFNAGLGNNDDDSVSGYLHLFNPSSTTFVKHFIGDTNTSYNGGLSLNWKIAGYINTTAAIDEIQFKMSSGNIDAGDICLYGIA